jgi:hypothetical protein
LKIAHTLRNNKVNKISPTLASSLLNLIVGLSGGMVVTPNHLIIDELQLDFTLEGLDLLHHVLLGKDGPVLLLLPLKGLLSAGNILPNWFGTRLPFGKTGLN